MKKIATIFLLVAVNFLAIGQQQTKNLSLEEAFSVALSGRADMQAMDYNALIAQNNIDRSKREWIPDISASANVRYNLLLQGTLIPEGFGGLTEPKVLALGAKNVTAFGVDINEPVYRPTLKTDLSLAELNLEAAKENKLVVENSLKSKIAEAYYNVNLKKLQWQILGKVKNRFNAYLQITEGKYKNGAALESEYLKTKLDVDNAEIEMAKAEQAYQFAMSYLKYLINVPAETELVLTDSLSANEITPDVENNIGNINRPELRLLKLQDQSLDLLTRRTKEGFLPTVSVYANLSVQFLYNNFDYTKSDYWNPFSFIGVRMAVPITAKFKAFETLNEYALKLKQSSLDQTQKNADINFEIEKATTDVKNARLNLKSSKMSYDLSADLYQQQVKQFELGALLYTTILDTERTLNTSEQNYVKAVYDYYIAKISLNKATGRFE